MQLTIRQAASYFGVDEATVRQWIGARGLPVHRLNERQHLNAIEVWEWAVEQGIPVSRTLLDQARRTPERVPPLSQLLETGRIHRDVEGDSKNAVLASLVERLPLPAEVDREHLLAVLESREAMGSTGIGNGIAIPHVRNPILLHVSQPMVALFLLRRPVDFDSIDGQPVHAIFLVISPSVPSHLRILAELGFALRDPALRELLQARAPDDRLMDRIRELGEATTGQFPARQPPT
ncbi:MAG TPA: PTS sugar transporter subunit IIA [Gemmatimonadales bacterium]